MHGDCGSHTFSADFILIHLGVLRVFARDMIPVGRHGHIGCGSAVLATQQREKMPEQVMAVVGAGGCFGMVLDAKRVQRSVPNPFNGMIVEASVGHFQVGRKGCLINRKTMVLGRDFNFTRR